ncbi:MAG: LiaF-related protein [Bacteroidia bacterium]|nr:LiaF-related protein [Bacteroidia bacterium]
MENKEQNMNFSDKSKGGIFGFILILAGTLFLAFNRGWLDPNLRYIVFSWPMIFVVFTFFALAKREYWGMLFWSVLAAFFLLPRIATLYPNLLPGINEDFAQNFWPVLLIIVGIGVVLKISFGKNIGYCNRDQEHFNVNKIEGTDGIYVRKVVFGGNEDIFLEPIFRGGKIDVVFGGVELDLRRTTLSEGDTHLQIEAVFGGVKLYLPDDWVVVPKIDAVLGGVENKRFAKAISTDGSRRLLITGEVVFGGCEIR